MTICLDLLTAKQHDWPTGTAVTTHLWSSPSEFELAYTLKCGYTTQTQGHRVCHKYQSFQ